MIIGTKTKTLTTHYLPEQSCQSCDKVNVSLIVRSSYFHILWIPVFPYKKENILACENCRSTNSLISESPEINHLGNQLKSNSRHPYYLFSGLSIIPVFLIWFVLFLGSNDERMRDQLLNPLPNDIYFLYNNNEPSGKKYSLLKVRTIKGDTIYTSFNRDAYHSFPSKLNTTDGFYEFTIPMHKSAIQKLYDEIVLIDIQRGFSSNSGFGRDLELTEEEVKELKNNL